MNDSGTGSRSQDLDLPGNHTGKLQHSMQMLDQIHIEMASGPNQQQAD